MVEPLTDRQLELLKPEEKELYSAVRHSLFRSRLAALLVSSV
jgi:hypothetical protein